MNKEKRIQLKQGKLLGFKHLAPVQGKRLQVARAMVGGKVPPPAAI